MSTTIELTPTKSAGELLTVRHAATFLGVGPATVYRMLKDGRLPVAPVMLGGEMRLSPPMDRAVARQPDRATDGHRSEAFQLADGPSVGADDAGWPEMRSPMMSAACWSMSSR